MSLMIFKNGGVFESMSNVEIENKINSIIKKIEGVTSEKGVLAPINTNIQVIAPTQSTQQGGYDAK